MWVEGGGGLHRGEEVIVIDDAVARGEATVSTDLVRVRVRVRIRASPRGGLRQYSADGANGSAEEKRGEPRGPDCLVQQCPRCRAPV